MEEDIVDRIIKKCESTRIMTKTESLVEYYPQFSALAKEASISFWLGDEYPVEDDLNDFLVNMSESELHGVKTVLKLFTHYEIVVGCDYWSGYVMKKFPRPEITRMASAYSHVENNSHAVFYDLINKVLGLSTDEFYSSYINDATLNARAKSLGVFLSHPIPLVSIGAFSMIEGAVLYGSFGFLKSFSTNGKNLIRNASSGISASVTDELGHSIGGATLYNTLLNEANLTKDELNYVRSEIIKMATIIYEHESKIIDMIFEKGELQHISAKDLKIFVMSRINECLINIGIQPLYTNIKNNKIAEWFYNNVNTMQSIDFFNIQGKEYTRGWIKERFIWG
jgi:ribonucleotide reductase beta subunit family protein with ferritin-like domain